jgi:hypothetical protein
MKYKIFSVSHLYLNFKSPNGQFKPFDIIFCISNLETGLDKFKQVDNQI